MRHGLAGRVEGTPSDPVSFGERDASQAVLHPKMRMHPFCQLPRVVTLLLAGCVLSTESRAANLLRDINTIPNAISYVGLAAVDLANITLFVWDDGIHGQELWATDGTPAGTHLVRDINPGPASS